MELYNKLKNNLTESMKNKNDSMRDTIRMVLAEVNKYVIDNSLDRENVSDEIVTNTLLKVSKNLKESIEIYEKQNRPDLAEPEKAQLQIIMEYLPKQLSDEELKAIIEKAKAENPNLPGMALMGKIMPQVKGLADPERIKAMLM